MFAVFDFFISADASADASSAPSSLVTIAISLGTAIITTVGAAMAPGLAEVVKGRIARRHPVPLAPPPLPIADPPSSQDERLVEEAMLDYRRQRDDAMTHYYAILSELETSRSLVAEQSVAIARLQARLNINEI